MYIDKKAIFIPVAIAAALSAMVIGVNRLNLKSKKLPSILLKTSPSTVQIRLDGGFLFDRKYVKTPKKISIAPGKHHLKVIRKGFASQAINFTVRGDKQLNMNNIILGKTSSYKSKRVIFTSDDPKVRVFANINNGFIQRVLPFTTNELELSQTHSLRFTIESKEEEGQGSETIGIITCNFQLQKSTNQGKKTKKTGEARKNKQKAHRISILSPGKRSGARYANKYSATGCHESY